jgi:hypothetical protein
MGEEFCADFALFDIKYDFVDFVREIGFYGLDVCFDAGCCSHFVGREEIERGKSFNFLAIFTAHLLVDAYFL